MCKKVDMSKQLMIGGSETMAVDSQTQNKEVQMFLFN